MQFSVSEAINYQTRVRRLGGTTVVTADKAVTERHPQAACLVKLELIVANVEPRQAFRQEKATTLHSELGEILCADT